MTDSNSIPNPKAYAKSRRKKFNPNLRKQIGSGHTVRKILFRSPDYTGSTICKKWRQADVGVNETFRADFEKKNFTKALDGKIEASLDKSNRWDVDIEDFKKPENGPEADEVYFVKAGKDDQGLEHGTKDYDRWFVSYYNYEDHAERCSQNAFFSGQNDSAGLLYDREKNLVNFGTQIYLKDRLWKADQQRKKMGYRNSRQSKTRIDRSIYYRKNPKITDPRLQCSLHTKTFASGSRYSKAFTSSSSIKSFWCPRAWNDPRDSLEIHFSNEENVLVTWFATKGRALQWDGTGDVVSGCAVEYVSRYKLYYRKVHHATSNWHFVGEFDGNKDNPEIEKSHRLINPNNGESGIVCSALRVTPVLNGFRGRKCMRIGVYGYKLDEDGQKIDPTVTRKEQIDAKKQTSGGLIMTDKSVPAVIYCIRCGVDREGAQNHWTNRSYGGAPICRCGKKRGMCKAWKRQKGAYRGKGYPRKEKYPQHFTYYKKDDY